MGKPPQYFTKPTQPPTLIGTGNEYQPNCGYALRLGSISKGRKAHALVDKRVGAGR